MSGNPFRRTAAGVAAGLAVAAAVSISGEEAATDHSEALRALQAKPRVSLAASGGSRVVTGPLDIYAELVNLSENDVSIQRVDLELPGEVEAARRMAAGLSQPGTDSMMQPGHQRLVHFRLPPSSIDLWTVLANPQLLTFVPGEYRYRVVVRFRVPPSKETAVSESGTLTLEPPLLSLIWGGVLGSVLLAAFVGTYRLVRNSRSRKRNLLVETALLALGGAVCAVIALLLPAGCRGFSCR